MLDMSDMHKAQVKAWGERQATGPAWFIIGVTSGKELPACALLARKLGLVETFFPTKRVELGPAKRRRLAETAPRYVTRAWVPGYVFAYAPSLP